MVQQPQPEQQPLKKPKPTRAQLSQEIGFDLLLIRSSLTIEILSHALVILFPAPAPTDNLSLMPKGQGQLSYAKSQAMFVAATSLTALGSGTTPAIHSMALCMLQVRATNAAACRVDGEDANLVEEEGAGGLFGAFGVVQAVAQTILGVSVFLFFSFLIRLVMVCIFSLFNSLWSSV